MDTILKHLLTQGPGYLLAAAFLALFLYERWERKKEKDREQEKEKGYAAVIDSLTSQLIEVSKDSVQSSVAQTEVLRRVEDTLSHIVRHVLPSRGGPGGSNE